MSQSKFGGKRSNEGKAPVHLLVPEAMEAEARVWGMGAEKYGEYNWQKGMEYTTVLGCAMRHLMAIMRGEDIDPESGLPHAAHVKTNMSMLIFYMQHKPECDDRLHETRESNVKHLAGGIAYSDINDAEMDKVMAEMSNEPALYVDKSLGDYGV